MESNFDGKVLIVRNFMSQEDCSILNDWTTQAIKEGQFSELVRKSDAGKWPTKQDTKRLTNRTNGNISYPKLVYDIQEKIIKNVPLVSDAVLWEGVKNQNTFGKKIRGAAGRSEGKDGIMVTVTYDQGEVHSHKDFMEGHSNESYEGLRCNILTSKSASGGLVISDGSPYDLNVGDMMCFLATKYEHSVEKCIGDIPRILFIYGFILNSGEWEKQQVGDF
jgi:hypothetical protein